MNVVQLVKKARKGSKNALLQLILCEKEAFYKLAYTYMKNPDDAMDVLEEMIVTLYENIYQLNTNESFYSWSKTILKQRNRTIFLDNLEELSHVNELTDDKYKQIDQRLEIEQLLLHLNALQREATQLKYFHDLDYETVALIMNTSISTAKSRVFQRTNNYI